MHGADQGAAVVSGNRKNLGHYASLMFLERGCVTHIVKNQQSTLDMLHALRLLTLETALTLRQDFPDHDLVDRIETYGDVIHLSGIFDLPEGVLYVINHRDPKRIDRNRRREYMDTFEAVRILLLQHGGDQRPFPGSASPHDHGSHGQFWQVKGALLVSYTRLVHRLHDYALIHPGFLL